MPALSTTNSDFRITHLVDRGDIDEERVILEARKNIRKGSTYLVFDNTFDTNGNISNQNRHLYCLGLTWDVDDGDLVIIYTKSGNSRRLKRSGKNTHKHIYYWGRENTVWNIDADEIVHVVPLHDMAARKFDAE